MRKEPNLERRIVGWPDAGKSLQDFLAAWLGVSRRAAHKAAPKLVFVHEKPPFYISIIYPPGDPFKSLQNFAVMIKFYYD